MRLIVLMCTVNGFIDIYFTVLEKGFEMLDSDRQDHHAGDL